MAKRMTKTLLWWAVTALVVGAGLLVCRWLTGWGGASVLVGGVVSTLIGFVCAVSHALRTRHTSEGGAVLVDDDGREMRVHAQRAVRRYRQLSSTRRIPGLNDLYDRPWFLVLGAEGAGRRSLFTHSGLALPARYPSTEDGAPAMDRRIPQWFFGRDAVWVLMPPSADNDRTLFRHVAMALKAVRPRRPIDGVLVVADLRTLREQRDDALRSFGQTRRHLDLLMEWYGAELPVRLAATHIDSIPGLADAIRTGALDPDAVLGSTEARPRNDVPPLDRFLSDFEQTCGALADDQMVALSRERDPGVRCNSCRFWAELAALREPMNASMAELFSDTGYVGRPAYDGFFFTGTTRQAAGVPTRDTGRTVAEHPLNPKRGRISQAHSEGRPDTRVCFAAAGLVPGRVRKSASLRPTSRVSRRRVVVGVVAHTLVLTAAAVAAVGLVRGYGQRSAALRSHAAALVSAAVDADDLVSRYRLLKVVRGDGLKSRRTLSVRLAGAAGICPFRTVLDTLAGAELLLCEVLAAAPARAYMQGQLASVARGRGELSSSRYSETHAMLKASLLLAGQGPVARSDTAGWGATVVEAAMQAAEEECRRARLPVPSHDDVARAAWRYCRAVSRGDVHPKPLDVALVQTVRRRLSRRPEATGLYRAIRAQLCAQMGCVSTGDTAVASGDALRCTAAACSLYTGSGWTDWFRPSVAREGTAEGAGDWVLGQESTAKTGGLDADSLRDVLHALYVQDAVMHWQAFLDGCVIDTPGHAVDAVSMLRTLADTAGPLVHALRYVSAATSMDADAVIPQEVRTPQKASRAAGAATRVAGMVQRVAVPKPLAAIRSSCAAYRAIVDADGTLREYLSALQRAADELEEALDAGDEHFVDAYAGEDGHELKRAADLVARIDSRSSDNMVAALCRLLVRPVESAGHAVSVELAGRLNARWRAQVHGRFVRYLSRSFPFSDSPQEVPAGEVLDFFRPRSGTVQQFVFTTMAGLVRNDNGTWVPLTSGQVQVVPTDEFRRFLATVADIGTSLCTPDGTPRVYALTVTPMGSSRPSELSIGSVTAQLIPGGRNARMRWSAAGGDGAVSLSVQLSDGSTRSLGADGDWGLVRLLEQAEIRHVGPQSFGATWSIDIQGMYVIPQMYRIDVSAPGSVLGKNPFRGLVCPERVVEEGGATDSDGKKLAVRLVGAE